MKAHPKLGEAPIRIGVELDAKMSAFSEGGWADGAACLLATAGWNAQQLCVEVKPGSPRQGIVKALDRAPANLGHRQRVRTTAQRRGSGLTAEASVKPG